MAAKFLFTLELNFRFLFILQIAGKLEAQGWEIYIRTNKGEGYKVEVLFELVPND